MIEPLGKVILISGSSGLIGTSLIRFFSRKRIQTIRLLREGGDGPDAVRWNPDAPEAVADPSQLEDLNAVIHLSGANLAAHRWTDSYKREIAGSRVGTTRALVKLLTGLKNPPRSLLCASAVGIYGDRGDEILTESSLAGTGFLANTCRMWEAEADAAASAGMRVVHLRFGVVLARESGALRQMLPIFKAGLAGPLGSGRQWMSWITASDLARAVLHILEMDSLEGPVNLVAAAPLTNSDFTRALGSALNRPAVLPVPGFALRAVLGEIADEALLASTRAVPERLIASGFRFDFSEIDGALRSVL